METFASWLFPQRPTVAFAEFHELKLRVNNEEHTVKAADVHPSTTLNSFLRNEVHLTGTKNMCLEGGCGACIVAVTAVDPVTYREVVFAVNSCLVPIYTCFNWKIHTIESIGNSKIGYHPIQKALAQFNGTQCGFCTPGMVMNMYALYESGTFTMKDVENSFGGNICRCTGYRPILSAFKSLAVDASSEVLGTYADIEDIPVCKRTQGACRSNCAIPCTKQRHPHFYTHGECRWVKVFSINETLDAMREALDCNYMIVGGNTAMGVYRRTTYPDVYIDITSVKGLIQHVVTHENLILGANTTLTNTMNLFDNVSKEYPQFSHLRKLAEHIDLIANVPVRNIGTLAGNLMTKHQHHEFPSDIFLILETVGASLVITDTNHQETALSLGEFLTYDMHGKLIKNIIVPALDHSYRYESYKITIRAQNAHALVNAGFLLKLSDTNIVESARIVYGAINPVFIHAAHAETYLIGKQLFDNTTLQGLFQTMDAEIVPDHVLPDPSPEFRKQLAISLCYKFILSITPDNIISPRNISGRSKQSRPVSNGAQDYETNESMYPISQPISKIEALAQCTGEAEYIMDMPDRPGQLHAAFVLAKAPANSVISRIDASHALHLDGVVAFLDKDDIPGANDFTPVDGFAQLFKRPEELFCSGVVQYYFQPVGIVVAKTHELAVKAAEAVEVSYMEDIRKPLITVRDILEANAKDKITREGKLDARRRGNDVRHVVRGTFDIYWQYHYHMETQCCIVVPVEDGLDMYPSTQSMNVSQIAAARALNIPVNKINVSVRRLGGAYGAKISRNSMVSTAAAIAAYKLKKPIKFSMPLTANMNAMGKRYPATIDYEVGVNNGGVIQYLNATFYSDLGSSGGNENFSMQILNGFGEMYNRDTWDVTMNSTRTDTPTGTSARAPGSAEMIAGAEAIMQHIAVQLNIDPLQVRLANLNRSQQIIATHINNLVKWADVDKRRAEVEQFNQANRWVKKGISVVPMLFNLFGIGYWHVLVSIYQADGSVAVCHGGIEMGQGINTKVAQTCAYTLGIPLDKVSIKPSNVMVAPNTTPTGASTTSESVCYATWRACETLKERMRPIRERMNNPTWLQLVQRCYRENVDLSANSLFTSTTTELRNYPVYGATCVEIEVDILTGQYQCTRADILEDTGNSLSPQIDIGQVEGAFVMGMGYWTSEEIIMTDEGELLTNRTWNYKPPGAKDIPVDFRIQFPRNNPNRMGFLFSKATAEPPLCMACGIPFAIRSAVASARLEANPTAERWYPIDGPSTVENTFLHCLHDYRQYAL